jgi:hypothetical protein
MENFRDRREPVSIYLSEKNKELLNATAKSMGMSRSGVVSLLVNRLESRFARTDGREGNL